MRLREVFGEAKNLGKIRRIFPLNLCYLSRAEGESPQGVTMNGGEAEHRRVPEVAEKFLLP